LTACCLGNDLVGGFGPGEGLAAFVPAVDVGLDRGDEVLDRGERAAADGLAGDDAEEDLHHVQPGPRCRGEVQRDPGVFRQPGLHVRVLVGGVVVGDDVQLDAGVSAGGLLQELQELFVPVAGITGIGDLAGGDLQGGEQRGGAVADVVVGGFLGQAGPHRQDRRGPVQGLDLRFLIDRQHHRLVGRVQVEPDDVADLGLQLGVGGELERLPPPGLQAPLAPDPRDPHVGDPQLAGQQPGRPVRHTQPLRRRLQRRQHHRHLVHLRRAARLRPVPQAGDPLGRIPFLPRDHRRLRHPGPRHDLARPRPIGGQQHNPRPPRQPRRHRRRPQPPRQLSTIGIRQLHGSIQRHSQPYREVKLLHSRDTR
jgi:hypothetical protein